MEPEKLNGDKMTKDIIGKQPNTYTATKVNIIIYKQGWSCDDHSSNIFQKLDIFNSKYLYKLASISKI